MANSLQLPESMALLPEETMAVLRKLEWLARKRMQGTLTGKHTSPEKGFSVEFAEHREYSPGDDPRNLDWRVMAKNDRNVIKQYIEETNLRVTFAVDVSGSMKFTGNQAAEIDGVACSKFDYARHLTAALSYLYIKQGDSAGLVTFDSEIKSQLRSASRPSQVRRILDALWQSTPGEETQIAGVLHEVAERIPRRGLVVLVSDFFDDPKAMTEALHHFDFRQHELVVFHVLAEEELTFPFKDFQRFRDLENVEPMLKIDPQAVRAAYLERLQEFVRSMEVSCGKLRADYVPVTTKTPLQDTLIKYVGKRMHARR
ncbi:MAG: DUF58 domain-containing protein [Akkermansiaceae bacterium]